MIPNACPICHEVEFSDFNGRLKMRCNNCGSLERTRLLFLILHKQGLLRPNTRILHIAPEPGLFRYLRSTTDKYTAADLDPKQYEKWSPSVEFIDLCNLDLDSSDMYDLIIHNHVLEHISCNVSLVLANLQSMLRTGGTMLFSVPIRQNAVTTEDMSDQLSVDERKQLFGQADHVRIFGTRDVMSVLNKQKDVDVVRLDTKNYLTDAELKRARIPLDVKGVCSHSIFSLSSSNMG